MVEKKAQYKIQQMAFMILAIFFFFILVGLFFVGYQYAGMKKSFSYLQEEKALSALKVIADSTEFNCKESEDWCIDKDKLIAFSENSEMYQNYFSVASIELLFVYPKRGEGFYNSVYDKTKTVVDCSGSYGDHNGDGFSDKPASDIWAVYSFVGTQGPFEHLPTEGDALMPLLVLENLEDGEKIKFQDVMGSIILEGGEEIDCSSDGLEVVVGFYSGGDSLIQEFSLVSFMVEEGIEVPNGAKKLYAYFKEDEGNKDSYGGNSGGCSFSVRKVGYESCYEESSSNSLILGEPVLCPAPYCDYYILYDSGQRDKQTFSAYVNVCETIDRSHEFCELAKLMLGVKIVED